MKKLLLICVVVCAATVLRLGAASADTLLPVNLGFYGAFNFNMHSPDIRVAPLMTVFDKNKTSVTGAFGIIFNYPIDSRYTVSGRLGYYRSGAEFASKRSSDTTLDCSLGYVEFSPVLELHNLFSLKPLYLVGGFEFGFPAKLSADYSPGADTSSVKLQSQNFRLALVLGAGYTFRLNDYMYLSPEMTFRLPFTSPVSSGTPAYLRGFSADVKSWSAPQIRIGASLTFSLNKEDYPGSNSSTSSSDKLSAGFSEIRYYDDEGNRHPVTKIKVEDVKYTEIFPVLPYVFYNERMSKPSTETQSLYSGGAAGPFTPSKLRADAIEINKSVLDIVGDRMKKNENANLKINGTTDGKGEKGETELAADRANFAKEYLVKNHGIDEKRITVTSSALPAKPSTLNVEEGVAENRRIELSSDNPEILAPVITDKDNQRFAEPHMLEFVPFVSGKDSVASWRVEITQAGEIMRVFKGTGRPAPMQWSIFPNELTDKQLPVEYKLTVTDTKGATETAKGRIPVDYYSVSRKKSEELADRNISKYSLIQFDFDKADIPSEGLDIIKKYIIPAVKFNSTIKIYGYTDNIGNSEYNKKLAQKRAEAVRDIIKERTNNEHIEVYGVGFNDGLFDQSTPIGRHLARTVQIYVVTPR